MDSTIGKSRFSKLWGQTNSPAKQKGRSQTHDVVVDYPEDGSPPPPPPKDSFYAHSFYTKSASSLLQPSTPHSASTYRFLGRLSPAASQTNLSVPPTPASHSDSPPIPGTPTPSSAALSFKSKFKLPKLTRRPSTSPSISSSSSVHSTLPEGGDADITAPYNFSHDVHVDDDLAGLPAQWSKTLAAAGYSRAEIHAIYARKLKPTPPPPSFATTSQTNQIVPKPRSSSLNSHSSGASDTTDPSSSHATGISQNPANPSNKLFALGGPYPSERSVAAATTSNASGLRRVVPPPIPPNKDAASNAKSAPPRPTVLPTSPPPPYRPGVSPHNSPLEVGGAHYTYSEVTLSNPPTTSRVIISSPPSRSSKEKDSAASSSAQREKRASAFNLSLRREKSGSDLQSGTGTSLLSPESGNSATLRQHRSAADLGANIRARPSEEEPNEEEDQLMPLPKSRSTDLPPRLSFSDNREGSGDSILGGFSGLGLGGSLGFGLDEWSEDLLKSIPGVNVDEPHAKPSTSQTRPVASTSLPASSSGKKLDATIRSFSTDSTQKHSPSLSSSSRHESPVGPSKGTSPNVAKATTPKPPLTIVPTTSTSFSPISAVSSKPTLQLPPLSLSSSKMSPVPSPSSDQFMSDSTMTPVSIASSFSQSESAVPSPSFHKDPPHPGDPSNSTSSRPRHNTFNSILSPISPLDPDNPATTNIFGTYTSSPTSVQDPVLPGIPKTAPLNISPKKGSNPRDSPDRLTGASKVTIVRSVSRVKRTPAALAVVSSPVGKGPTVITPVKPRGSQSPVISRTASPSPTPSRPPQLAPQITSISQRPLSALIADELGDEDDSKGLLPYLRSPASDEQGSFAFAERQQSVPQKQARTPVTSNKTHSPQNKDISRPISTFTPTLSSDEDEESADDHEDEEGGVDLGDVLDWYDEEDEVDEGSSSKKASPAILQDSNKRSDRTPTARMAHFPLPPGTPTTQDKMTLEMADLEYDSDSMTTESLASPVQMKLKDPNVTMPPALVPLSNHLKIHPDYQNRMKKFTAFTLIAEGQSGSCVYSAKVGSPLCENTGDFVALKVIRVPVNDQSKRQTEEQQKILAKLDSLTEEMEIMKTLSHPNVFKINTGYLVKEQQVDDDDDDVVGPGLVLWLEMELMERSLADVLSLVSEGLSISEPLIARFAKDILEGLNYLQSVSVAHRDVRSDNILVSRVGFLKLADFSSATLTTPSHSKRNSLANQPPYWMAPEMRKGLKYDPHEADIWSTGATIWEAVEGDPPFIDIEDPQQIGDRLPPLSTPEKYSQNLHAFLRKCSEPATRRPKAAELLRSPFVRSAGPSHDVVRMMTQVREMEGGTRRRPSASSDRTA